MKNGFVFFQAVFIDNLVILGDSNTESITFEMIQTIDNCRWFSPVDYKIIKLKSKFSLRIT